MPQELCYLSSQCRKDVEAAIDVFVVLLESAFPAKLHRRFETAIERLRQLLTIDEGSKTFTTAMTGEVLGISAAAVLLLIKSGDLFSLRKDTGGWHAITRESLTRFVERFMSVTRLCFMSKKRRKDVEMAIDDLDGLLGPFTAELHQRIRHAIERLRQLLEAHDDSQTITVAKAANEIGCSASRVRGLKREGELTTRQWGSGKRHAIPRKSLDRYIERLRLRRRKH